LLRRTVFHLYITACVFRFQMAHQHTGKFRTSQVQSASEARRKRLRNRYSISGHQQTFNPRRSHHNLFKACSIYYRSRQFGVKRDGIEEEEEEEGYLCSKHKSARCRDIYFHKSFTILTMSMGQPISQVSPN
jgi:hypothetical protein